MSARSPTTLLPTRRAFDDADHAGTTDPSYHLVAAEGLQLLCDRRGGTMDVVDSSGRAWISCRQAAISPCRSAIRLTIGIALAPWVNSWVGIWVGFSVFAVTTRYDDARATEQKASREAGQGREPTNSQ